MHIISLTTWCPTDCRILYSKSTHFCGSFIFGIFPNVAKFSKIKIGKNKNTSSSAISCKHIPTLYYKLKDFSVSVTGPSSHCTVPSVSECVVSWQQWGSSKESQLIKSKVSQYNLNWKSAAITMQLHRQHILIVNQHDFKLWASIPHHSPSSYPQLRNSCLQVPRYGSL